MTSQFVQISLLLSQNETSATENDSMVTVPICSISRMFVAGSYGSRIYGIYTDGSAQPGYMTMDEYHRVQKIWGEWMETYRPGDRAELELLRQASGAVERMEALLNDMASTTKRVNRDAGASVISMTSVGEKAMKGLAESTEKMINVMVTNATVTLDNAAKAIAKDREIVIQDAKATREALTEVRSLCASIKMAFREDLFAVAEGDDHAPDGI